MDEKFLLVNAKDDSIVLYKLGEDDMSLDEIEECMRYYADMVFEWYCPDTEIPDNSVSIGRLFDNKYTVNCQINYTKNDFIVKCTFYKSKHEFIFNGYKLVTKHVGWKLRDINTQEERYLLQKTNQLECQL